MYNSLAATLLQCFSLANGPRIRQEKHYLKEFLALKQFVSDCTFGFALAKVLTVQYDSTARVPDACNKESLKLKH